jgi:hypothetical protein
MNASTAASFAMVAGVLTPSRNDVLAQIVSYLIPSIFSTFSRKAGCAAKLSTGTSRIEFKICFSPKKKGANIRCGERHICMAGKIPIIGYGAGADA